MGMGRRGIFGYGGGMSLNKKEVVIQTLRFVEDDLARIMKGYGEGEVLRKLSKVKANLVLVQNDLVEILSMDDQTQPTTSDRK
jgi:hypothetical protein